MGLGVFLLSPAKKGFLTLPLCVCLSGRTAVNKVSQEIFTNQLNFGWSLPSACSEPGKKLLHFFLNTPG